MALYRVTGDKLEGVPDTSFAEERMLERKDLQRLLKADISPLGEDLMVMAEEFGDWEESSRRIDLLCLDKQARLVVVEIKRTEGGGHMELQAIRYAAMVSSMTLDQAISTHARMIGGDEAESCARKAILEFLEADSPEDLELASEVRIVLVSANFSQELTTSVIWLNEHDLDIRCVRLKPYRLDGQVLVDATQIIPLPEATDYAVRVRVQKQETRKLRTARGEIFRRFWAQLIERSRATTQLFANRSTTTDHWLTAGIGRSGFSLSVSLTEDRARVQCYIRGRDTDEWNTAAFNALKDQKAQIEAEFGQALDWQDLPNRRGCRICREFQGGWKLPEAEWPALQDRLIDAAVRLERALKDRIQNLAV